MKEVYKISVIGDIDENAYAEFVEQMDDALVVQPGDDIVIELTSHGGDAMVALAFYDRIRQDKREVTVIGYGMVASAAVIILAAGDKRYMSKNAWVMVHDDTTLVTENDRVSQAEMKLKTSRRLEDQWYKIMAERTKLPKASWQSMHESEEHLDSTSCLLVGLIDKVI